MLHRSQEVDKHITTSKYILAQLIVASFLLLFTIQEKCELLFCPKEAVVD